MSEPYERGNFKPPALLRNPHLQSILPSLPPRRWLTAWRARTLRQTAREWRLDCGSLGVLQAWQTRAPRSTGRQALLLHGWEGSADSGYVLSLGALLLDHGYDVVRLNLRDHGGTQHLNRELFHSCRLPEVAAAVRIVAASHDAQRLYLAGFSLGGNFLLRVAAEPDLPANLAGVVAVSPVLDPHHTLDALERKPALYHGYFVARWARSLRVKQRCWPQDYRFDDLLRSRNLRRMTDELVRRHTAYPDSDSYLSGYAIVGERLGALGVPARMLLSEDDPIIPAADLARLAASPQLRITRVATGGHCGFMERFGGASFADRYVLEQFAAFG